MKCYGSLRSANGKIHNFKKEIKYPPISLYGVQDFRVWRIAYILQRRTFFSFLRNATYHHLRVNKVFRG